ncbi:MAG: tetratricopeptide repeat protein [Treponema sp.]|nr:tetratricopeptide repeat protein [Treponema sp.]
MSCALFAGCADKGAARTLYIKALERYGQKDFEKADAFIDQSLKLDKKNDQAKFLKAKIYFFQGRYKEAQEKLLDLQKSNSDLKDIQTYLIRCLILDGQKDLARKTIDGAIKKDKGDWRLHQLSAVLAAKEENFESRLEALNNAQEALQGAAQVYYDLSTIWRSLGVQGKAAECKERCLALDKSYSERFTLEENSENPYKKP